MGKWEGDTFSSATLINFWPSDIVGVQSKGREGGGEIDFPYCEYITKAENENESESAKAQRAKVSQGYEKLGDEEESSGFCCFSSGVGSCCQSNEWAVRLSGLGILSAFPPSHRGENAYHPAVASVRSK